MARKWTPDRRKRFETTMAKKRAAKIQTRKAARRDAINIAALTGAAVKRSPGRPKKSAPPPQARTIKVLEAGRLIEYELQTVTVQAYVRKQDAEP